MSKHTLLRVAGLLYGLALFSFNSLNVQAAGAPLAFTDAPNVGTVPLTVQFTAPSGDLNGLLESWNWDFGDGSTSTAQNPTHTYTNVGVFTPTLSGDDVLILSYIGVGPNIYVSASNYVPALQVTTPVGQLTGLGSTDGPRGAAIFSSPGELTVDANGNIYFSDLGDDTIRKVTPAGFAKIIAGQSTVSGTNEGPGLSASFSVPNGIAADASGNLYVANYGSKTIEQLKPNGTQWTVARVAGRPNVSGTNDGLGTNALFESPYGLAVDPSGNLFVSDIRTIRKITPSGSNWTVVTLAGNPGLTGTNDGTNGGALFEQAEGVATDSAGNVYVADAQGATIRMVTAAGVVTTLAGKALFPGYIDGFGPNAHFSNPQGIAVDKGGNIYVADVGNKLIRKMTLAGTNWDVTTVAGSTTSSSVADGSGANAGFGQSPTGLAVDNNGNILVADSGAHSIRECTTGSGYGFNISGGSERSLFLSYDGSLWGMGDNSFGQLGNGTINTAWTPTLISSGNVAAILTGDTTSYFITKAGNLMGMGENESGQLGNGTTSPSPTPVQITNGTIAVAGAIGHTMFIQSDGSLWGMGLNEYGELGDRTTNDDLVPTEIVPTNVVAVAANYYNTYFIKSDGSLWATGDDSYGQLGDGNYSATNTPEMIVASNVTAVAAGRFHALFLKTDGSLWGMGNNAYDQLGNSSAGSQTNLPIQILSSNVVAIAAGTYHSLFVKTDGSLWGMGNNTYGQMGTGTNITFYPSPVEILSSNVTQVSAGAEHSLFIKADGSIWGMGADTSGELGDGNPGERFAPQEIAPFIAVTATPTNGTTPLTVQFTGPSQDANGIAITSWHWTFGDGATSTNQSPAHIFTTNGAVITTNFVNYYPALAMTNANGFAMAGAVPGITVDLPTVQFSASPTSGSAPLTVSFVSTNRDSGGVLLTNWHWNFGDGGTGASENMSHTYTNAGSFTPTLTVINTNGSVITATGPVITAMQSAPVVSETPSSIDNNYTGSVSLRVTNLPTGATILVQKYIDANADGVVGPEDWLISQYEVTDGVGAPVIGGVTNVNIPADWNPTNGAITILLDRDLGGAEHSLTGHYLYVISSPNGLFPSVTNQFTVTNTAYAQSISGTVTCNGTNVPNALVWLLAPGNSITAIGGTVADGSGSYSILVPPGTYQVLPAGHGFVANITNSPVLTVPASQALNAGLSLASATVTINGSVADVTNAGAGLPGLLMLASGQDGTDGIGTTDSNGNFSLPALSGQYKVGIESLALDIHGYVDLDQPAAADTTGGNVSGLNILLPQATALLYGSVTDINTNPLPGVRIQALNGNNGSGLYQAEAATGQTGNYVIGLVAGNWSGQVDAKTPAYASDIFSAGPSWAYDDGGSGTNVTSGTATVENFSALTATSQINGLLTDDTSAGIPGIGVTGFATINGTDYLSTVDTGLNGAFAVNVTAGNWSVNVNCGCSDGDCLGTNYLCPVTQNYEVGGGDVNGANFIAPLVVGQISGYIIDDNANPLANIGVSAAGSTGGGDFSYSTDTDGTGYYSFNVANGDWEISVNCQDGSDSLFAAGYQCVSSIPIVVNGDGGFANFTPQPQSEQPPFVYTAVPTNGAAPLSVQFGGPSVDSSDNSIVSWFWGFGDGGETNGQNPAYVFNTPGLYNPYLAVSNNLGVASTVPGPTIIVTGGAVQPSVQAWTTAGQLNPGGSGSFAIINLFGSPPFSFQWALNGTNIANATNAGITISNATAADAGNYTVTIINQFGTNVFGPLTADYGGSASFTASPVSGAVPLTVSFSGPLFDSASIPITNWAWQFGDGTTDTNQNPSHTYNASDTYYPALTVINNTGDSENASGPSITVQPYVASTNIVVNGGFETGDFTGWTLAGDTDDDAVVNDDAGFGPPNSGNYFAIFGSEFGEFGYLSQTLPTIPGSNYILSFWVNFPPPDPDDLQVSWGGTTVFSETNINIGEWTGWQKMVTATSSNTVLTFASVDTLSFMALDDISVTPAPAATACATPPAGLAYWWPGQSNANDIINSNNGTLQGGVTFTNGEVGKGFSFDGATGFISTTTQLNDPENFSLGLWFNTTTTNGGALIGFTDAQTGGPSLFDRTIYMDTNGAMHFGIFFVDQVYTVDSLGGYNDGQWHYVAASSSTTAGIQLYLDGGLVSSDSYPTNAEDIIGYWRIGQNGFATCCWPFVPADYYFQGLIDEVTIYDSVLTSNQVAEVYDAGSNGLCGGPPTQVAPTITWATPAAINYGTPLGTNQLNAQASVPGTFTYSPPLGTILNPGTNELQATFTPTDTADYSSVQAGMDIIVLPESSCTPPPSGLVSWWPANGNAADIVGGNAGSASNITYVPGEVGQAFNLTNLNAGVLLGNPTNLQLQNFTIEAWIQRASTSIVSLDPNAFEGNGLFFSYGVNGYGFGLFPGGSLDLTEVNVDNITTGASVTDTNWHHVAVTKSGSAVVLYVDGVGYPYTGADTDTYQFTTPAAIGVRGDTAAANFTGQLNTFYGSIDELSIYNRALASNEIAAIYYAGAEGKCAIPPGAVTNMITFDDINDNGGGTPITNGYHGFNWSNFFCFNTPLYSLTYSPNGYLNGTVSSPNVAYNYGGTPAFISSTAAFKLVSGNFTAAWNNGMNLATVGFNGTTVVYSNNFIINVADPVLVTFPNTFVTSVEFIASGGESADYDGSGTQFALDNLVVQQSTPEVAWPAPASIVYGTPLGSNQLNATANVPGTFSYTPASGTILNAGVYTLNLLFTPYDTSDYASISQSVPLVISRAPLTVTASNLIWLAGTTAPVAGGTLVGTNFADGISATFAYNATSSSAAGTYPIIPIISDPNQRLGNYVVTTNIGILTISKGVALTSPVNGAIYSGTVNIPVAATASLPGGVQSIAVYMNSTLVASANGSANLTNVVNNVTPGEYRFSAVVTGSNSQTFTQAAYVTVNTIGMSLINFDPLDTSLGVMSGLPLSSYLAGFGVAVSNVSFGTTLEAATGTQAASQNRSVTNALPVPLSSPNLFTQVGSTRPISFTLKFAPQQSFGFTRIGITNTGTTPISHPAWSAHALDASGNELESVSEPLLFGTNPIAPRTFTLVGNNIASVRFNSDSQAGTAAFSGALLDDLVLSTVPTNDPLSITMSQPSSGTAPFNVPLSAGATDTRTNIDHVSFYSGPTLIGTVSNAPYNFTWSNVLNGTFILTAQAVDKAGYARSSAPVTNTVQPGGNAIVMNFDALSALGGPVTNAPLADYLAAFDGAAIATNSPATAVAVENQAIVAGGGFVTPSSLPNLLTQIGSNGPVNFTVSFSNYLSQFGFTRPQLLANPYVTHPAWQVQAFDAVGRPLGSVSAPRISSGTNVSPQTYMLTNPPGGGGIASVNFSSQGTGLSTFNAMLLDDFVLTTGSNPPPSVAFSSPTNGQVFSSLTVPLNVNAFPGSGVLTSVTYYFNGTLLTNVTSPFSASWNAPSNGTYVLTAVASNSLNLADTSAPVMITISPSGFAIVAGPTNETVGVGGNANFSVTNTGNNVAYQWQFNGNAIAGATLPNFSVNNTQASAAGSYTVVISSGGESITSQPPAVLTVLNPPFINSISPGTNVAVAIGTNLVLTVSASEADPISFYYQWQRNGQFLDGATNSSFVISNAQPSDSGQYQVLVANIVASQESPVFNVAVNFAGTNGPDTANDVFASSLAIDPTNGPTAGDSSESPANGEVPVIAGKPAGKFLWFNWTANFTGVMTLSTLGSSFDTLMGIYTGRDPGSLTTIAEDDDSAGYFASECTFNCTTGTMYQIAVAGYKGASGDVVLSCPAYVALDTNYLTSSEPEIVQQPESQLVLPGGTVTLSVMATNAATYQWYFNDAPIPGATAETLVITNFPDSASGNYYLEAANDIGSVQSDIAAVQAQTQGSSPTLTVDKFGDAVDLAAGSSQERYRPLDDTGGYTLSQSFSTQGATKEQNEPNHAGQPGGASYWYSYTAPGSGTLQFNTAGSSFNTILAIYTGPGDSFATLTNVGAAYTTNYVTQGQPVVIVTNGTAGTKYFIAIDGYQGASGAAHLNIVPTVTNATAGSSVTVTTNNSVVLTMAAPANNIYTTSSNLTVRGTVRGIVGAQSPLVSFVQLGINSNPPGPVALNTTNYAGVRTEEPGGAVGVVPEEIVTWSSNVTLVPGANVITAQSISVQGASAETASRPVTHTVFLVTSLPTAADKSIITLIVSPAGHGRITGVADHANLEVNKVYRVRAENIGNYIFTNWTSGTNTNALAPLFGEPALSFIMTSNLILQANFVTNPFTAVAGAYNGLFAPASGVTESNSGFFSATLPAASRGSFSAKLLTDGGAYPFSGSFDLSGDAQHTVNLSGHTPVTVSLHLNLTAPDDLLTGTVTGGGTNGWTSPLLARAAFSAKGNPPTNYAGKYTMAIAPGSGAPTNAPGGYSYATLTANNAGHIAVVGRLADNTGISQAVAISKDGNIPFYVSLYSRKGVLLGWLNVTNQSVLGTNLTWIKLPSHARLYAAGFTNSDLAAFGSLYTNKFVLTNATLTVSNGNLSSSMVVSNISLANNKLTSPDDSIKGTVAPGTGVLTLTIKPDPSAPAFTAKGVVLENQGQTNAAGWFLGTDQSGYFLLQQ